MSENFIPIKVASFVPFGAAFDLAHIIISQKFIPTLISGETGYGKTMIVNQLASFYGREVIRVNCTPFTNEDDFFGHYALEDGNTVWKDGPVLFALERNAILLLDEVDSLDPKRGAFPLYSLLEGSGVFVKKLNKRFLHKPGFLVIATSNTKGKGDLNGRYVGTNVQNAAFLDRFIATIEHKYPAPEIETKILNGVDETGDFDFINKLVEWASAIRKTYDDGGCDEFISTRRLCIILTLYGIYKDRQKAIDIATTIFDNDTKISFMELYTKIDAAGRTAPMEVPVKKSNVTEFEF